MAADGELFYDVEHFRGVKSQASQLRGRMATPLTYRKLPPWPWRIRIKESRCCSSPARLQEKVELQEKENDVGHHVNAKTQRSSSMTKLGGVLKDPSSASSRSLLSPSHINFKTNKHTHKNQTNKLKSIQNGDDQGKLSLSSYATCILDS